MPKNIIVFSDGTGQDGGIGPNTNVYNLFNMIEDRTPRQVSFYDRGLGTGWRKCSGMIGGYGISRNIRECYEFISDHYEAGDQIYLIGFSRGATTVRTLAAFIDMFGLLPRSRPELIKRAYKIYKNSHPEQRRIAAEEFVDNNHTMWCRVRFLGVWDTVAALGLPFKALDRVINLIPGFRHEFHDLSLNRGVDYARHAMAIDDRRKTFLPQMWDEEVEDDHERDVRELAEEDIHDVYLIAERLRLAQDPVSKRLKERADKGKQAGSPFDARAWDLIQNFGTDRERKEPIERVRELRTVLAKGFEYAVNAGDSLYDPKDEGFKGLGFSERLAARIGELDKSKGWRRLNRLLLEETYSLRPADYPRVKQVWFCGMHSDVGGGYPESELAHIALLWMLREAMGAGLRIFDGHNVKLRPNARGMMHDSRAGWGAFYREETRSWDSNKNQGKRPLVHETVKTRQTALDRSYAPWILKMKVDTEPWPQSLQSNIQFDDFYIWRECFWGRNNAFLVSWSNVDRIKYDEAEGKVRLYLKKNRVAGSATRKGKSKAEEIVVVHDVLPGTVSDLISHFDRRTVDVRDKAEREREKREEDREDALLRKQDEALLAKDRELTDKIEKADQQLKRQDEDLRKQDKALRKKDRQLTKKIDDLRAEQRKLEKKLAKLERVDRV